MTEEDRTKAWPCFCACARGVKPIRVSHGGRRSAKKSREGEESRFTRISVRPFVAGVGAALALSAAVAFSGQWGASVSAGSTGCPKGNWCDQSRAPRERTLFLGGPDFLCLVSPLSAVGK